MRIELVEKAFIAGSPHSFKTDPQRESNTSWTSRGGTLKRCAAFRVVKSWNFTDKRERASPLFSKALRTSARNASRFSNPEVLANASFISWGIVSWTSLTTKVTFTRCFLSLFFSEGKLQGHVTTSPLFKPTEKSISSLINASSTNSMRISSSFWGVPFPEANLSSASTITVSPFWETCI